VARYAVWGGVPRYWELASEYRRHSTAVKELVFNRDGILHNEPRHLLLDDMRSDTQPHSLLAVIGSGVHRLSEISARLGKPAMNLLRPLEILIELDLVRREIPFGELEKNTKRTLYTIADPFLRFWYRYVCPNLSALEQELYTQVSTQWEKTSDQFIGGLWESLSRDSVPFLSIGAKRWKEARRWWGKDTNGEMREIDIVAESLDGTAILLGEAKWGVIDVHACRSKLEAVSANLPFIKGKKVVTACWVGRAPATAGKAVISPVMVLKVLR
jgi:AAA+ ATPase superfamily predicted ATPase